MTDKITYKEPFYVWAWLEAALKKEWQKHAANPVMPDMVPGYELAQAWGYVVAGYFLIEQGLKAILHVRGDEPPKTHALSVLFEALPAEDQTVLRAFYKDFRHTFPSMTSFPFAKLDEFIVNLDGARNSKGNYIGSFDWRYFLTEERSGASMPRVSIYVMHEIVYGCVRLLMSIDMGNEGLSEATYSGRLQSERSKRHRDWLTFRMNSPGWGEEGDRLEILWGPDYASRYDYLVFEGKSIRKFFGPLPNAEETELSVEDKRRELDAFDPEKEFPSVGFSLNSPERRRVPESQHLMY